MNSDLQPQTPEIATSPELVESQPLVVSQLPLKPKISKGWKVTWIVMAVINVLLALALTFLLAQNSHLQAGNIGTFFIVAPLAFILVPLLYVVLVVDIVLVFAFLFYLLTRERKYSKSRALNK